MVSVIGLGLGALWGWFAAARRGGNRLDQAQYAAGFGIAGCIAGVALGIILTYAIQG